MRFNRHQTSNAVYDTVYNNVCDDWRQRSCRHNRVKHR